MGVSPNTLLRLAEFSGRFRVEGPSLMLGRQKFRLGGRMHRWRMDRALRGLGNHRLDDLVQPDGYSERMFERLGFPEIETLDASLYEFPNGGRVHVHDLNRPVPDALHGRYGFIYDGGTLEHVFNVPMALENIFRMLRPGGRVIGVNPLNGWPGHGMYQFSAELIYGFWARMAGCRVIGVRAYGATSPFYTREIPDPGATGRRTKYRDIVFPFTRVPPGRILMQYEVEKIHGADLREPAQQPDYLAAWSGFEGSSMISSRTKE
jgi:SAM-dependent methyltransferase